MVRGTALTAGGLFTDSELALHINSKELMAVLLCLEAFCKNDHNTHIQLLVDNITAVAYIREMGGTHSDPCNALACRIWDWAAKHDIWLSVAHVPGAHNVEADRESRRFHKETEWQLQPSVYQQVVAHFKYTVNIDLMASRTNCKVPQFMSWRPEPNAIAVDAFAADWRSLNFWCFPPFSIILRTIGKIRQDQATELLVVPFWPTQPWFPVLMQHLIEHPCVLPRRQKMLQLPEKPHVSHPLQGKLQLLVCKLSGDLSKVRAYRRRLQTLSSRPGAQRHPNNMDRTSSSGQTIVVNNRVIPFIRLFPRC